MYFGVVYHPEQWIYPHGGTKEHPEAAWDRDIELMVKAGVNVVRFGEFTWGLCEPEEGKFNFAWMRRMMDKLGKKGIDVVLATPTAAPPAWLTRKHPEILPINEHGLTKHAGTRRAACLNSDIFWSHSKAIVEQMARALGDHPRLIAWQIDNGLGGHFTEAAFNEDTRRDWHLWLEAKYETIERLNQQMGLAHWGQVVTRWDEVPMPMSAPTHHNPALVLDWRRFCSDTIVQFARCQAEILREITPKCPVTTNLQPLMTRFDHFDLAEVLDYISIENTASIKAKSSEIACEIDMLRSLKKTGIRMPGGSDGFWVSDQRAGNLNWQEANHLMRPGVLRMFAYQLISRGANGVMFARWRQSRFGSDKFEGAVLPHNGKPGRVYEEVTHLSEELKLLKQGLKGTRVQATACILYSHDNEWALQQAGQPNSHFGLREHIQLFYNALHDRNIPVDFARPSEDLSQYKLVVAPSLHLLSGAQADNLKLYVQNGGTLVSTFNTGMVDEHNQVPDTGYPHDLTDLFGMEVVESDQLPPGEENHLTFKGMFSPTHMHSGRIWCDLIEPGECQIVATYSKDFYIGRPAITMNQYGLGKAIYIGTLSQSHFYTDLVTWLRQICNIHPLLKVPDTVEVGMRQKDDSEAFFLLNHQNTPVRITFYKPMHDFLTGSTFSGNYDLQPHGVLVLDEHSQQKTQATSPPRPPM